MNRNSVERAVGAQKGSSEMVRHKIWTAAWQGSNGVGASRPSLLWMVLKESIAMLLFGILLGIPVSLAASRAIRAGLFGVEPTDPLTLVMAALMISACLLAGSYLPARRAAKIDPMTALRYE